MHPIPKLILTLAAAFAAALPGFAQAPKGPTVPEGVKKVGTVEGITEYKLDNGLRILLLPDASQPKVTVNCTVFVGSRHEGYGETGMAHLLEHMVFKGCPKFPNVPKALADHGAQFNGTTWVDRTNYFETMPASDENLEFGIELEADRLVNSFIKREDLMSEFSVVRSEFERGENDTNRVLFQKMLATAYEWHNYGKSTIGNRTDIERVPIDNLQAFYKKYYRPDNALVTVAGKFDESKALALIAKHFGGIKKPSEPIPATYTEEPPQDGERIVSLRRVGDVAGVGAVYHVPAAAHPEFAACEVLSQVLSAEPTGRLYKNLVETKKASSTFGFTFNWHDPGVIVVGAQTEPEKIDDLEKSMIDTIENLSKNPVTAEEVERAKRTLLKQREQVLSNSQSFAISLSDWAGCGDWRLFFLHRDRLEKVTADDVNKAAAKYLIRSNRTLGVYHPTKKPERAQVPENPDVAKLLEGYAGRAAMTEGEAFDPTPANVEARVQRGKVGKLDYAFLKKGTRGDTVQFTATVRFGNEDSLKGLTEAAEFVGPMLMRGTKNHTREQIKDEFDKLKATVNVNSSAGAISITGQTKKANLPAVLALLGEVLREPVFPQKEFDVMKAEELENYEKAKTDPQQLAVNALRRKLAPYPADDVRYTPTIEEQIARTKAVTIEQVKKVYEQVGGVGQLAVVGDFDPDAVLKELKPTFADWASATPFKRIPTPSQKVAGSTEKIITLDKPNAVYVGALSLAMKDTDPDYAPLAIGNYLLGGAPLASRLSLKIRGKDGLSYGVGSQVQASPIEESGQFLMFAIANPTNMPKVESLMLSELKGFEADGVSAADLEVAKKGYLQAQRVQRGNDGTLARQLATALYAGRTFDYYADLEKRIEAVSPADITAAFGKSVDPKNLVIVVAGDLDKKAPPKDEPKK